MANVLNGLLAFAGDKASAKSLALLDISNSASRALLSGDKSILVETFKGLQGGAGRARVAAREVLGRLIALLDAQASGASLTFATPCDWRDGFALAPVDFLSFRAAWAQKDKPQWLRDGAQAFGEAVAASFMAAFAAHVAAQAEAAKSAREAKKSAASTESAPAESVEGAVLPAALPVGRTDGIVDVSALLAEIEALTARAERAESAEAAATAALALAMARAESAEAAMMAATAATAATAAATAATAAKPRKSRTKAAA